MLGLYTRKMVDEELEEQFEMFMRHFACLEEDISDLEDDAFELDSDVHAMGQSLYEVMCKVEVLEKMLKDDLSKKSSKKVVSSKSSKK